ncbi:helix-turn-helix domain-containing protein [Jeotgalibacillus sp. JSM ZJ347]|uniref:helix-turn-helix domain-containing protein n=1 Tax=Jeotgalibacillus sp. JSM ZJ347 TaxID=3342117 RepID=UPI0035A82E4C
MKTLSLANFLKHYREDILQISQKEAAIQLNIQPATLSNYERGIRQVPIDTLRKIKEIYRMDDELFISIVLHKTADPKLIKESQETLSRKIIKAEDQELIDFLRENPALLDEIRTLSHMPPSKQKTHVRTLVQLLKVLRSNYY